MSMTNMAQTPAANRIHIGFFGRCNAGKSTLINMLTGQSLALVSNVAGTTTDPVSKAMEVLPLGPVMLIDTAGVDDTSELGPLRIQKTQALLPKINLALYVLKSNISPSKEDINWIKKLKANNTQTLLIINEVNQINSGSYMAEHGAVFKEFNFPYIGANLLESDKQGEILTQLGKMKPKDAESERGLLEGLIESEDIIVLVCPIDSAAPKGRLILPQVQMIREVLDGRGMSLVVQTEEVSSLLKILNKKPKLVITDSQAFEEVAAQVPNDIPLTSFSILMARFKGDLKILSEGVQAITNLKPGSKVLISEGCTHHRQCDDIGSVKIPRWLKKAGYEGLELQWTSGGAFPDDVSTYDLIIHCGACMLTRREVLRRLEVSSEQGVPIVNYGVLIAALHGILERALTPFKHELK